MAAASSDPIQVIHVDDEPDFAEVAATFVERQDDRVNVETATNPSDALDRIRANGAHCVVSDFDMPEQNGIEFLEAVREEFPDLPFILYTGKGSEEVASEAISAGVTDYLQKETGTSQYEVLANRIENAVEQHRAQVVADETEHRLQTIAENSNDILWKFTSDWDELLFINSSYEKIWGRSIDELRERPESLLEGVHPDDRTKTRDAMERLSSGESIEYEHRVNADEDFGRWVWVKGEPVFNEAGEVEKVVGFARDITDRKKRVAEIERLKDRFQAFTELASDVITVVDEAGLIQYESPSVERVLGYDPDELIGTSVFEHVHPDDREGLVEKIGAVVGSPGSMIERVTYRFKHADGSWVWLESIGSNRTNSAINGFVVTSRDVTDRKERERELERFRDFFAEAERLGQLGAWEFTASGEVIWTAGTRRIHEVDEGFTPTVETGIEFYHPEDRESIRNAVESTLSEEEPFDVEARLITAEDENRWVRSRGIPLDNGDRVRGYIQDITDRKEQARRREQIIERVTDAIVEVDADWQFTLVNEQAEELYDMSEESLLGRDFWEVFEEAKDTRFEQEYRQVMDTREPTSFVEEFSQLSGWFEIEAYPLETGGIAFYFRDVTEQRQREQALQERVKELTVIHETSQLFQSREQPIEDLCQTFVDSLPRSFRFPEFTAARLTYRGIEIESNDFEPADHMLAQTADIPKGGTLTIEVALTEAPPTGAGEPFLSEEEALLETLLSIVQNHLAQRARIQELERVRDLLEQTERIADVAGWEIDPDSMDVIWTENLSELLGGDYEEEPPVEEMLELHHEDDRPVIEEALDRAINQGEPFDIGARIHLTDGELRWFRIRCQPTVAGGGVEKLRGTIHDVTEHKAHERALKRQNERLQEFASIVSHDLRNPLSVAQGRLELALEDRDWEELESVPAALDRIETLIDDMLALANAGETIGETHAVQLAELANRCWRNVATESATLRTESQATIQADESRLQQLLENLLRNAVEHGGDDVTVTIGDLPNGFYVEDDGPGIPSEERDTVFDAGYSSSQDGTGFGLSIVRDIAEAHGWKIAVSASSYGGARFEFQGVETA